MRFNSGRQYLQSLFDDQDVKGDVLVAGVGAVAVVGLGELDNSIGKDNTQL